MVRSHSHTLTKLEGPIHPAKVSKGSGASSSPSKFAPLSLSITDMIKLGKIGTTQDTTTVVHLHTFDMDLLSWSKLPITVEFNEEKEPFAHGEFRNAHEAATAELASSLPKADRHFTSFMKGKKCTFRFTEVSEVEVFLLIESIDCKRSFGNDKIHPLLLSSAALEYFDQ